MRVVGVSALYSRRMGSVVPSNIKSNRPYRLCWSMFFLFGEKKGKWRGLLEKGGER